MPDLLLVYVTKSGNTRLVAEAIADGARSMGLEASSPTCAISRSRIYRARASLP